MEGVQDASSITSATSAASLSSPPPFLCKTYDMVDDPATNLVVSWSKNSNSFVVWNVPEFARDLLPKYFKHNNFSSFVRQLNTYGFRKVDPDRWEFANEGFLRGQKHLLKNISRRKPAHVQSNHHQPPQQPQIQSTSVGACVEVMGKFGLEEEVEILKRDKNILMQELVRLRQQQQTTDNQLQTVGQRVQVMEQRQQQIMSFLAKAMQSPGFFAQFVQQQNESNRRVSGSSKKRRLPKQEEENSIGEYAAAAHSPDGQIVKYQPSMNEAAKAMVRQIKEMNASPIFEPSRTNSDGYNVVDTGSSSTRASGVTLSEVTPTSLPSFPTHPSETQSSPTKPPPPPAQYPEMNVLNSQDSILLDFTQMQGIEPENAVDIADVNFVGSVLDGDINLDSFSSDPDSIDGLLDGIPKLPGINDAFWEQFLATSPLTGDTDEINSSTLEPTEHEFQPGMENVWNRSPHMDHLTAQMGLLASNGKRG